MRDSHYLQNSFTCETSSGGADLRKFLVAKLVKTFGQRNIKTQPARLARSMSFAISSVSQAQSIPPRTAGGGGERSGKRHKVVRRDRQLVTCQIDRFALPCSRYASHCNSVGGPRIYTQPKCKPYRFPHARVAQPLCSAIHGVSFAMSH